MFDCIIIGSGPAGMSAAIYAARNNLKIAVMEGGAPGGQMINTSHIDNYPGIKNTDGANLSMSMYNQVLDLKVEYIYDFATQIKKDGKYFIVVTSNNTYQTKTIIYATGAKNRRLAIEGENEFVGKGISWCAICDGNLYKNEDVAVIGGGNSSIEEAIYLSSIAKKVYIIHRRSEFRAEHSLIEKAQTIGNIQLVTNVTIRAFKGSDFLEGIIVEDNSTKKIQEIKVKGAFEYVGMMPSTEILKSFDVLNENGYVEVDENCETKEKGLFAAGDVRQKNVRQIVTAVNDGAIAALNASKYCK